MLADPALSARPPTKLNVEHRSGCSGKIKPPVKSVTTSGLLEHRLTALLVWSSTSPAYARRLTTNASPTFTSNVEPFATGYASPS